MGKISIISNISSKKHAGAPFCVIDYKKNCKIENDKIKVVVDSDKNDTSLANKIMRSIQSNYTEKMYITVEFK